MHHYQDLITIFNACFATTYNTRLVKGDDEPIYLPAGEAFSYHAIFFAHGFFSSALHECAHWFIAGKERRKKVDFGYWYVPDGRTVEEQKLFQAMEVKPQALEWVLSVATGHRFRLSIDNLNGSKADPAVFKQAVYHQVASYCKQGLPQRARVFRKALCDFYKTSSVMDINQFELVKL